MKPNQTQTPNKKLILHFDLDHVIRLPVRKNKDLYVYDLCSNWVWGRLEKNSKEDPDLVTGWKLAQNTLSKEEPEADLVSYSQYLKDYAKPSVEEWENLILNLSKGPAGKAKAEIQKTIKNITIPKTVSEGLKDGTSLLEKKYMDDGKYEILPSFYKTILWLKKNKRQFSICVKSPDIDAHHVQITEELNMFFNGQHPLYNGKNGTALVKMDGNNKTKNFVLEDSHFHIVYPVKENKFVSTFGTQIYHKEKDPSSLKQSLKNNAFVKVCQDIGDIYAYFHSILAEGAFIYEINPLNAIFIDNVDYFTHEIHFTKEATSNMYNSLGDKIQNNNSFVQQVDEFQLLRDLDYFVKKIQEKEKIRAEQISRIQKGQTQEENLEEQQISQRDQETDEEYLKKNIVPILQGALRHVDMFRPEDPVAYVAYYCLKNRQRIE